MSVAVHLCIKSKQIFSCAKKDLGHLQIKYNNILISLHYYRTISLITVDKSWWVFVCVVFLWVILGWFF